MVNIIVELSKYLMIILMTSYTFLCFSIFGYQDPDKKKSLLRQQNVLMFMIHIIAYLVMYLEKEDIKLLAFYLMQVVLFGATILLYTNIYPRVSRLVVNNMCMLLCIGMIMLTRLSYSNAVKQFVIAAGGVAISLVVPVVIRKVKKLSEWRKVYAIIGIVSLALVIVIGSVSYGAKLGFQVAGINVQPSELVKIVFVFFVASSFKQSMAFKDIVVFLGTAQHKIDGYYLDDLDIAVVLRVDDAVFNFGNRQIICYRVKAGGLRLLSADRAFYFALLGDLLFLLGGFLLLGRLLLFHRTEFLADLVATNFIKLRWEILSAGAP